jgi:hypothetical protein
LTLLREASAIARALGAACAGSPLSRALLVLAGFAAAGALAWHVAPEENRVFYLLLGLGAVGALAPVLLSAYRFVFVRGAEVRVGWGPGVQASVEVHPEWPEGSDMSQPVALQIGVANRGDKTAHSVLYNVLLPDTIRDAMSTLSMGGIHPDRHPPDGLIRFIYDRQRLLPSVSDTQEIQVRFPPGSTTYPCVYILNVDDRPPERGSLEIRVVDEPERNERDS